VRNPAQLVFEEQGGGEVGAINSGPSSLGGVAGVGASPAAGAAACGD
jgi:hypothetical protein